MRRSHAGGKSAVFMVVIGTNEKGLESIADFPTTLFISCLHVQSMSGAIRSFLVHYGKLRLSETKTNLFELWRA